MGFDTAMIMEPVPALLCAPTGHRSTNLHNPGTCNRPEDQYGEGVSILTTDRLAALGVTAPLPDVVVLGREVAYEVHYTDQGQLDGATRHTARAVVDDARAFIQRLHGDGEPLASYFPRAIAGLRPPNQPEPDA